MYIVRTYSKSGHFGEIGTVMGAHSNHVHIPLVYCIMNREQVLIYCCTCTWCTCIPGLSRDRYFGTNGFGSLAKFIWFLEIAFCVMHFGSGGSAFFAQYISYNTMPTCLPIFLNLFKFFKKFS